MIAQAEMTAALMGLDVFDSVTKVRQAPIRGRGRKTTRLADAVIEVFEGFDGTMSTRQVYYQLVSRGAVANSARDYDQVQRLLVSMRHEGSLPYSRVVDRTRGKHQQSRWDGVTDAVDALAAQYHRDLWACQGTVVMVACEKQALEGIFAETVDPYGVSLWTLRGYSSVSFAYEWAIEIRRFNTVGTKVEIAYFGDFDPSGLGIELDAQEKLRSHGAEFTWRREGLLQSDFDTFDLVNVPVKATDSRAKKYLNLYGNKAAELDALRPDELRNRIELAVTRSIDVESWNGLGDTEEVERRELRLVADNWEKAVKAAGAKR